jgi:hypothetical protein
MAEAGIEFADDFRACRWGSTSVPLPPNARADAADPEFFRSETPARGLVRSPEATGCDEEISQDSSTFRGARS